jgi:light-regulated signal transduction histidine kinase (bacteriophytochrome)
MDGFETAALIKQRPKSQHTPIIFVTAINRTEDHVFQGYDVGAVDYLFKPIVPEVLRAKVSVFIDLFTKTQEIGRQAAHIQAMNQELEAQLREVRRLNHETEALNQELESFSYSVSHDLRSPLRSINSFSQALMQDYHESLDAQGQHYLQRIQAGCQRMSDFIEGLLQLSRLTRQKLQVSPVNLSTAAAEIVDELRQVDLNRQVTIAIEPNMIVNGDGRLLRILLHNLLGNAWKFTSHHPTAFIEFSRFYDDNSTMVYYVRDDGAGFDMEYADQLFMPFQRLHLDHEFDGTGIGLATVHRIVRRHRGTIWAEGKVEEGATFYFTL